MSSAVDANQRLTLRVAPRSVVRTLGMIAVAFAVLSLLGHVVEALAGSRLGLGFFDVNKETSIPTLYSAIALLLCSAAFGLCARMDRARRLPWTVLALAFVWLTVDEAAVIHERLIDRFRDVADDGIFFFAWVIPYSIAVLVFAVAMIPFLRGLPIPIRNGLVLAGAVYVGGALGFELIGGWQADNHGFENWPYRVMTTVEELLEMLGVALALATAVAHLASLGLRIGVEAVDDAV